MVPPARTHDAASLRHVPPCTPKRTSSRERAKRHSSRRRMTKPTARIRWGNVVGLLRWIDGSPLVTHIEPYRAKLFTLALDTFESDGRPQYNLIVCGRAKKNW